ncbi:MAG: phospholipid carrier-dependent glycosyltransferase [Oscillatoria sp. SIO1A7]|nr:phospholipid carrier-dependent glycosyltransferase [Oscillatoria sp. SIO1A7]
MLAFKKISKFSTSWFWLGMAGIFLFSVALRFWGLSRFNTLVFDETYFVKFANSYLSGSKFFDSQPPLGKYAIALGIWIGTHLPFPQEPHNNLAGSPLSPWTYRWLNALTGSLIPLVVAAIAYQLNRQRSYALLAALFASLDGLFLVESRYALLNIYLIIFGLLGQLCFLVGCAITGKRRWIYLGAAGINFGAAAAVKWNGLGFLLGAYLVWAAAWAQRRLTPKGAATRTKPKRAISSKTEMLPPPFYLPILPAVINLAIIPAIVYSLVWIPHLQLNPEYRFWEVHQQILGYHRHLGTGADVHPYCSAWYGWPVTIRPVVYFYQNISAANGESKIYHVLAMGNPALWWFSTAAIGLLAWLLLKLGCRVWGVGCRAWKGCRVWGVGCRKEREENFQQSPSHTSHTFHTPHTPYTPHPTPHTPHPTPYTLISYLLANYLANWLPWAAVDRCLFLYLYMGSCAFAWLAIAFVIDRSLRSSLLSVRATAIGIILLIIFAFIFWMPVYLGLPLSPQDWKLRMWLPSWI